MDWMRKFQKIKLIFESTMFQFGRKLNLGERNYRLRGFFRNRFSYELGHETHLLGVLRQALRAQSGVFIDVGANVGQTLTKVLSLEPTRKYLGFEPQVDCCFAIERFLEDNGIYSAQIVPVGMSNKNGFTKLNLTGSYDEMASLVKHYRGTEAYEGSIVVPVRRGDDVVKELGIGAVGIIKIDVEGAELEVLEGFQETIQKKKPIILFEVLPNFVGSDKVMIDEEIAEGNRAKAKALFQLFKVAGYEIAIIGSDGSTKKISSFHLDERSADAGRDYVAAHKSVDFF